MGGRRRAAGGDRWFSRPCSMSVVALLVVLWLSAVPDARAVGEALSEQRNVRSQNRRMLQQPTSAGVEAPLPGNWTSPVPVAGKADTTGATDAAKGTSQSNAKPSSVVIPAQDGGQNVFSQERCLMQLLYKSTVTRGNGAFYVSGFALGEVAPEVNVTSWKLGVSLAGGNTVRDQVCVC